MKKLQKARKKINKIDAKMAKLFTERMQAAKTVAEYKKEQELPVFDPAREAEVIERNSKMVTDEEMRSYYATFLKSTIELSKQYQEKIISG